MPRKISDFIIKIYKNWDWKTGLFIFLILLAIFLRTYNFSDWLFFKMDQARDAFTAKTALEKGPGYLSLLGPKAGSTDAKLGPAFYYFQYLSAFLFQSAKPAVLAYPDLLFSILTIPLLFIFLKKYFSRDWSMILSAAYALSFLVIEYSRFAWNPNSLPFFNLLLFYSLLSIFDENIKYKYRWIILAAFSAAVSTQLHFLSFLTLPMVVLVFLIFNRKKIGKFLDWKKVVLFFGIIIFLYIPVFAYEIHTHGADTREFFNAIHEKASDHGLYKNIKRDLVYFGQYWLMIMTGFIGKNKEPVAATIGWIIFILPGLYFNYYFYRKEHDIHRKNFLLVTLVWFLVYLFSYIPVSYDIRPRFFLPLMVLPFIFLGYFLKFLHEKKDKYWKALSALGAAIVIILNLYGTQLWFKEIRETEKKGTYPERTVILKARDGIVLEHLEKSADFMAQSCSSEIVYFNTISEYHRPIAYLLELQGKKWEALGSQEIGDPKNCYFNLLRTRAAKETLGKDLDPVFAISQSKKFGAWTVQKIELKQEMIGQTLPTYKKGRQTFSEGQETGRLYWKDIIK